MTASADPEPADWGWLANTYWYVRPANLAALQLDTDANTLAWVVDQTVWNITGYRDGYFWGVSATLIRPAGQDAAQAGGGSRPVGFTLLGSITPEGTVYLTFLPSSSVASATTGLGRAVVHDGGWTFEMQMSTGNDTRTAHWAYMALVQAGEPAWENLPGFGISVPEILEGCVPPTAPSVAQAEDELP